MSAPDTACANPSAPVANGPTKPKPAESAHVNPLEKIEQLLTCPICLDRYKQPKLLPCQHTFCLPCLDSYADSVHSKLKCPECRAEHTIPYEGVKSLQTNYTLMGFLDIHLEATEENAAELDAYVQRYNRERCKICDEKAELEMCYHCDRKACSECRTAHMEMLKRDLGRLLNQIRRLSNRVKEASEGVERGIEALTSNAETTKAEIKEYFERYHQELRRREESFILEVDTFLQTESRTMRTLGDVLSVENVNLQDACSWAEAVLSGSREAKDEELCRIKNVFADGVEYLRNFAPDSEEFFSKKVRFSPGDDAAKLPTAISNFGELTVSLPQFGGRYLPLEQQYLSRPLKMGLESDSYKVSRRTEAEESRPPSRFGRPEEDAGMSRYRRRQQLEDEARNRLRVTGADSGRSSPLSGALSPGNSPWSRPTLTATNSTEQESTVAAPAAVNGHQSSEKSSPPKETKLKRENSKSEKNRKLQREPSVKGKKEKKEGQEPLKSKEVVSLVIHAEPGEKKPNTQSAVPKNSNAEELQLQKPVPQVAPMTKIGAAKPPLPRQTSSTEDSSSLNDKIDTIRQAHEERVKQRMMPMKISSLDGNETRILSLPNNDDGKTKEVRTQRFRIIYRSASSRPIQRLEEATEKSEKRESKDDSALQPIPISHFPGNSTTVRYCAPPSRQDSLGDAPSSPSATESESSTNHTGTVERRSRFRRRSSLVPDREFSSDPPAPVAAERGRLSRASSFVGIPFIDYGSKHRPRLVFGRRGANPGEMNWPRGIAAMPGSEFAISDSSNHRIQIFNANGKLLRSFGKYGTEEGELDSCAGVAYNRYRQQIVVSDRYNHRIQIFEIDGKFVRQFGGYGTGNGKFNNPWGVAVDELGLIYVVDKDNHRVQVFDQSGNYMSKFGSKGEGVGEFNHPLFISIHKRTQNIYVSDSANHRICVFDHDGTPILNFGVEGFHAGELKLPRGIAVDDQGFITVADSGNNRVQIFSPDGKFIYGFGTWGTQPGQMKGIEGIALMDTQIIISDRENHRVQIF